jgi:hypothetical protein
MINWERRGRKRLLLDLNNIPTFAGTERLIKTSQHLRKVGFSGEIGTGNLPDKSFIVEPVCSVSGIAYTVGIHVRTVVCFKSLKGMRKETKHPNKFWHSSSRYKPGSSEYDDQVACTA